MICRSDGSQAEVLCVLGCPCIQAGLLFKEVAAAACDCLLSHAEVALQ